jgi:hypothetical protein
MNKARYPTAATLLVLFLIVFTGPPKIQAAPVSQSGDRLSVAGMMQNPQGKGVKEVEVEVLVKASTSRPPRMKKSSPVSLEVSWPSLSSPPGHSLVVKWK